MNISASGPTRHAPLVRAAHWLMALVIIAAWILGARTDDLEGPERAAAIGLHVIVASSVLVLIALRLVIRATHAVPPLPQAMSALARLASQAVHGLLYLLMIAMPMSGWLMSNSGGHTFKLLGMVAMPSLIEKNEALHERLEDVHGAMAWLLAALVVLHVAAALKHHFIDKDDVLTRMLPPR